MAWGRISDDFHDNDKVTNLTVDIEGLAAIGLWTLALSWVRADHRRRGVVPPGIVARLGAGHGKQLASLLLQVGLWEDVEGGSHFHDFDDIYHPEGLSEKRSAAGRSGGVASGRARRGESDESAKQVASSKTPANGADCQAESDPIEPGNSDESDRHPEQSDMADRSTTEATTKQSASSAEANAKQNGLKPRTRARASTTHYPEDVLRTSSLDAHSASATKRASRLPSTFEITPDMRAWARGRVPNVDIDHETEKFDNYWRSKSGRDATKLDWPATWRNWMLNAAERLPAVGRAGVPRHAPNIPDDFSDWFAERPPWEDPS